MGNWRQDIHCREGDAPNWVPKEGDGRRLTQGQGPSHPPLILSDSLDETLNKHIREPAEDHYEVLDSLLHTSPATPHFGCLSCVIVIRYFLSTRAEEEGKGRNGGVNVGQLTWLLPDGISAPVPVWLQGPHSHPRSHLVDQLLSWLESHGHRLCWDSATPLLPAPKLTSLNVTVCSERSALRFSVG